MVNKHSNPSSLKTRVISALILAPVVLGAIVYGESPFYLMILLTAGVGIFEWARMVEPGIKPPLLVTTIFCVVATVAILPDYGLRNSVIALITMALTIFVLARFFAKAQHPFRLSFGVAYLGLAMMSTLWLRNMEVGGLFIILLLLVFIWTTDIAAYFT
ncbi:MAG: hypothetical protein CUN55_18475, partial [Phototrophicales bacterium]